HCAYGGLNIGVNFKLICISLPVEIEIQFLYVGHRHLAHYCELIFPMLGPVPQRALLVEFLVEILCVGAPYPNAHCL
ncbi:hypothetical protein XD30_11935, partial [Staphylococcus aureus]|nr:hypothetical protein [Staphylococcus aureus]